MSQWRLRRLLLMIGPLLGVVGCYSPNYDNGQLLCSVPDSRCPGGYHCVDGRCWKNGQNPPPSDLGMPPGNMDMDTAPVGDMANPPPISYPAASVWIATGGGTLTGSNGAELNLSLPGSTPVGFSMSGNLTLSFGFLSTDTK